MDHAPLTPASFAARIAALRLPAAQVSVRVVHESSEHLAVVRGVVQPLRLARDAGAMVTVLIEHGTGYAASSDLSDSALHEAMLRAHQWAIASRDAGLFEGVRMPQPPARRLAWQSPHGRPLPSRAELIALLANEAAALRQHERILNWSATLTLTESEQWFYWNGECVAEQHHRFVEPNLEATAAQGSASQTRSLAGQYNGFCQQGGFEVIERSGLIGGGARVGAEALELLAAPNCPSGRMDLLLAPDQMMLQIHESIGHPLELDR
ncbi:MAG TPA: DNA gyrase modulator, partial [Burkholderiaceae bacterium]|nr:DNA gyrase modulator [Burkholderiaceae bacterium]